MERLDTDIASDGIECLVVEDEEEMPTIPPVGVVSIVDAVDRLKFGIPAGVDDDVGTVLLEPAPVERVTV